VQSAKYVRGASPIHFLVLEVHKAVHQGPEHCSYGKLSLLLHVSPCRVTESLCTDRLAQTNIIRQEHQPVALLDCDCAFHSIHVPYIFA
jgi:hypothetical protein